MYVFKTSAEMTYVNARSTALIMLGLPKLSNWSNGVDQPMLSGYGVLT